jgi:hypothetical protein
VAGPDPTDLEHRDTLIAVLTLQTALSITGLQVKFWNVTSALCFALCQKATALDVVALSVFHTVSTASAAQQACLDPEGDGIFEGYLTVESTQSPACVGAPDPAGILGFIYHTQLQQGLASGLLAPTFNGSPNVSTNFEEFAMNPEESLVFRLLGALGAPAETAAANTTVVVWSATSGQCTSDTTPVEDSDCLEKAIVVCDEEENCISESAVALPHDVNFLAVDDFLPVPGAGSLSASNYNGWFVLHNDTTTPLYVLGYSDNKADGQGATLNWEAIFPAPLIAGSPFE